MANRTQGSSNGVQPVMERIPGRSVTVGGVLGQRIENTWRGNLLALDWEGDFLSPFRDKSRQDGYVGLGKTLDGLVRLADHTGNSRLMELRRKAVETLLAAQGPDGYLGIYGREARTEKLWDVHEQAYVLMALLVDWESNRDERVLIAATRLGDYLLGELAGNVLSTVGARETEVNVTPWLALLGLDRAILALYRASGDEKYLDFCIDRLELLTWDPPITEGRFPPIQGHMYAYLTRCLAQLELYEITGVTSLLGPTHRVLEYLGDRRAMVITGTNSIEECWHSDQTGSGDLGETCATAYLVRLLAKLLCLGGVPFGGAPLGDWMERSIYNALFAAQSPDGRKLRYYAPFEGRRRYWDKDTYCCPGNFRRIIGELPELIAFRQPNGIAINLYAESTIVTRLRSGVGITIRQHTDYPRNGKVRVDVEPDRSAQFAMRLRIPAWCPEPSFRVNGVNEPTGNAERSLEISRVWKAGDRIEIDLPMPWRFIRGHDRQDGKVAVMRGPVVYCLAPGRHPELANTDTEDLLIDPDSLDEMVPDTALSPDGIGCRLRATDPASGLVHELSLSEFPDPDGEVTYFRCETLEAVDDENLRHPANKGV